MTSDSVRLLWKLIVVVSQDLNMLLALTWLWHLPFFPLLASASLLLWPLEDAFIGLLVPVVGSGFGSSPSQTSFASEALAAPLPPCYNVIVRSLGVKYLRRGVSEQELMSTHTRISLPSLLWPGPAHLHRPGWRIVVVSGWRCRSRV